MSPEEIGRMGSKHRKQSQHVKRVALIGAASATATCLTVGAAPPPPPAHHAVSSVPVALAAASTGPNYTELIESLSNSTNNVLFASANFQHAFAQLWNPIGAASGGLLPTGDATVDQQNLATLTGLIDVLAQLQEALASPNLDGIPGLPANSLDTILGALAPGLAPVTGNLLPIASSLTTILPNLSALAGVLTKLNSINNALAALNNAPLLGLHLPLIQLPDLDNLLNDLLGINGSATEYTSGISWPFLGISGSTDVDNTFVQLPSLTLSELVNNVLNSVDVPDLDLSTLDVPLVGNLLGNLLGTLGLTDPTGTLDSAVQGILSTVLNPLNGVATPSITAWIPAASGNYTLPLGGSIGYLATMPTLAIGPLSSLTGSLIPGGLIPSGLVDLNAETVLAIPLFAGGVTLPLGLASLATVGTPGILFPTATGVTTIGGASVTALNLFGLPVFTNTNLQLANYYGTNGIDWSNGQNIATVFGLPVDYSLGSFYVGDKGFGFAGPSLFGVGLLPPLNVGIAPNQESSDGLIGSDVLNLLQGTLQTPTQATSLTELLGIPDVGKTLSDSVLTPGYTALVTPLATQLTAYINANLGSWVNGGADGFEQLTAAIEKLSEGLPGAKQQTVPPAGESAQALTPSTIQPLVKSPAPQPVVEQQATAPVTDTKDATDPVKNVQNELRDASTQLKTNITDAQAKTKAAATKATADIEKAAKKAGETLNKIAKDGEAQIKKTADGVKKAVKDTVNHVSDAAKAGAEKKTAKK
jgi:hypothetical protein